MVISIDNRNMLAWREHYRRSGPLLYPDERIVVFLASQFPDRQANNMKKALDVGFGSGRHIALLLDYGFETHGIDYNTDTVEKVSNQFAGCDGIGQLVAGSLENPPFPEESFDVIVAWGVMFLRPLEEMKRDFLVMNRLLKPGGQMVVNFRTKDNWFFGQGIPLTDDTYQLDEKAGPYAGMCYTFLDADQSSALLKDSGFSIINMERVDLWKNQGTKQHSWNVFWARKDAQP